MHQSIKTQMLFCGGAIAAFAAGVVGGWFLRETVVLASLTVLGGISIGAYLVSRLRPEGSGSLNVSKDGISTTWTVRNEAAISTVFPADLTDSTSSDKAKELCNLGRKILAGKDRGSPVELSEVLDLFDKASSLDPNYWEPRANKAGVLVLLGRLHEGYDLAEDTRAEYPDNSLAYANLSLIMATAIESSIDNKTASEEAIRKYKKMATILNSALHDRPEDIEVRIALIKSLIYAGRSDDDIISVIKDGTKHAGFKREFFRTLNEDNDLKSSFLSVDEDLYTDLFPVENVVETEPSTPEIKNES